jgi:hypothetical protein
VRYEKTDPNMVNPFADTLDDPVKLQRKVAAVMKRIAAEPKRVHEPQWEDPGVHGTGKRASLRGHGSLSPSGAARAYREAHGLPPLPRSRTNGYELAAVCVILAGAGALALWLLRREKPAVIRMVPTEVLGFVELPAWAVT